jgi:cystathionine beta-lyase/cystathionine gamma-synthase
MNQSIDTQLVHTGERRIEGAISLPVFQTAMYIYGDGSNDELRYIRYSNSVNHEVVSAKLAALEGADAALVTASGMAAISTALLTVLKPGDHLLAQKDLYGGTYGLVTRELPRLGIEVDLVDADAPETWEAALRPSTRAFYVESITNPLMRVCDLEAVADFARAHGLVSLIDNTFTTPLNFRPVAIGFDLALHSATKYLNGHSDLVAGAVVGRGDLVEQIHNKIKVLGGSLDPHTCSQLHRGMKTLALRVRHQNESALRLARFLEAHEQVAYVNYPGLASHPQHARAERLFEGFGGMISFEPQGGLEAAEHLFQALRLPLIAPSLGGVESLVTRPAITSHAGLTPEERAEAGITDALIRFSVGIEGTDDLIADFDQALATLNQVSAVG